MNTPNFSVAGALYAPYARLQGRWEPDVLLQWDEHGTLTAVRSNVPAAELEGLPGLQRARGPVLPGMPNLHSHAFQAAMAGLTEYRANAADSFWSWRDLMYRYAARLSPESIGAIARWLYIEMLKAGYTSVCEFHYVHHGADGAPYARPAELAARVAAAAEESGLGMTMLPVLYQYSGFGRQAPHAGQRRFINTPEGLLALLESLRAEYPETPQRRYGVAPHSLRAVDADGLAALLQGLDQVLPGVPEPNASKPGAVASSMYEPSAPMPGAPTPGAPIHIHVAEQTGEVQACLDTLGARPVQWLMDNFLVGSRWCLVHATHMDTAETAALAASGAAAGLCLTTEANLGDGFFPAVPYLEAGGVFGIGSDSHIGLDWRSELRLLEYGQRLLRHERNVLASADQPWVADRLFDAAAAGGAQASGRATGWLAPGRRADFTVLDADHPALAGRPPQAWLSGVVFSELGGTPIRDVYVGGVRRVADGRHADEEQACADYRRALGELLQQGS